MGGVSIKEWWRPPAGGGLSLGGADDSALPAPAGDRAAVARLPLELRRRLDPHHDQWWLLPWEAYKHHRATDALRFYLQTRRGWLRVSNPRLRQMGQRGVCLGRIPPQRVPQPAAAPAEPQRRLTQSQWLAACAQHRAALEEPEAEAPAQSQRWRLVLRPLGTDLAGYRFTLTIATQPPRFGLFFDGTGNNLHNDNARQDDTKAPTNVAKLFELYPKEERGLRDAHKVLAPAPASQTITGTWAPP
jgi:hypothetical protein